MKKNIRKILVFALILISLFLLTSCEKLKSDLIIDVKSFLNDYLLHNDNGDVVDANENIVDVNENVTTKSEIIDDTYDKLVPLDNAVFTLSQYKLPKVGDEIGGFEAKNIYDFDERNAKLVEFYHKKSGATAFLISNDDEDKYAAVGFNTLSDNDKGIPHVFEHASLGGSEKYNSSNLFFEMTNRTYSTYLNASTMQCSTVYPMGSLSDEQLFAYYKMYLDGVFNPEILRSDKNFQREAYRWILNDKNDDLDIQGVVYSEMSAYEGNILSKAGYAAAKTLYNGSFVSSNVGGDISKIPDLTYEELLKFHNIYYTPSNMVLLLYGDINYEKYLNYINDEYLLNYDKKIIDKADKNCVKNNGFVEKTYDFPVSSDSTIEKGSVITYLVSLDGITPYEAGITSLILNELQKDDGPLAKAVADTLDYATYNVESYLLQDKSYISIVFSNVDENDKDKVKELISDAFKSLCENGISEENLLSYRDARDMAYELKKDSHGFEDDIFDFYAGTFMNNGDDLLSYFKYCKGIKDIEKRYNDGTVDSLIKKYFSNNDNSALSIVVPRPGMLEVKNDEFQKMLKNKKANMTDDELNLLVNATKEFDEWVEYNNSISLIDKVRVASVSNLPEYKAKCYAYEENIEGVYFIRSDIDDIQYSYCDILLDVSGVEYKDLLKLKLLSNLLLYLPTTNYEDFKLTSEFSRYAYSYGTSIYNNKYAKGGYKPYFSFSFMALNKNIDKIFELLSELMYETQFDDTVKLKNFAMQEYNSIKQSLSMEPSEMANFILIAKMLPEYKYDLHLDGVDYFNYLKEIISMSDEDLLKTLKDCENLLYSIYNRSGMTCEIISNFKMMSDLKSKVLNISSNFKNEKIKTQNYDEYFKNYGNKTAIESDAYIQYNYIGLPLKENELEFSSKYYVLDNVINDKILYPEFRVKRGAYGSYILSTIKYIELYTYRDPNLKETYDVYNSIPNMLKNIKLTNDELEDYKLSAYASFSYPLTKLGASTIAINEAFENWTEKRPERFIKYMQDIKNTNMEDVEELKKNITTLIEKGTVLTFGGADAIEKNIDLFDEIIYDYR